MAENGLEPTHNVENKNNEQETETFPSKVNLSNGNPFLMDLETSPDPHAQAQNISNETQGQQSIIEERRSTESGLPASSDVLIDFGTSKEPESTPEAEVKPDLANAEFLGDFDPFQRLCSSEMHSVSASEADDLMRFMNEGRGDENPIEVFSVPPPGPPDECEPEAMQAVLEMNSSNVKNPAGASEVESTGSGGTSVTKREEETAVDSKAGDQNKPVAIKSEKPEIGNDSTAAGQTKAKEERKIPQAKLSPRPVSTSADGDKSKDANIKRSRTPVRSPVTAAPKPVTKSLASPKKTPRSNSSKGQTDGEKNSLANSKTIPQSEEKTRAMSKSRTTPTTSVEQPVIKSPSPGSTPRSSVSASIDGRASVKSARSKIGSLDNAKHAPGGGNIKIQSQKIDLSNVTSKCGSKVNIQHTPGGGQKKIENKKLEWNVTSRIGSMDNAQHKPGGGDKKIETVKLDFKEKAQPKVGSKDNMEHKAGGGTKKIETKNLNFAETATSKIGSLNIQVKGESEPADQMQAQE